MKTKRKILLGILLLLVILFVPIPTGTYKDGGTKVYSALTYKIIRWNRLVEGDTYEKTRIYFLGDRFRSMDSLWDREQEQVIHRFNAFIVELTDSLAVVAPGEDQEAWHSSERISFTTEGLPDIGAQVGSPVEISYRGQIRETFPAGIDAVGWRLLQSPEVDTYEGQWLDRKTAKLGTLPIEEVAITEIYADCFFARSVKPDGYAIKVNGHLSEEWCVGDHLVPLYETQYHDTKTDRVEIDMLAISDNDLPNIEYKPMKPVIYLYPEKETHVKVTLSLDGEFTCTYPAYKEGWQVKALPDGTLFDEKGTAYNYLYWEGQTRGAYDFSRGFCVKGQDTAAFLEDALKKLGLTRREANEFIVYWLPLMEKNPYNLISFQNASYTDAANLQIRPAPDTLIRVFMAWQPLNDYVNLKPQTLSAPERKGFTAVEWGGTQVQGI